MHNKDFHKFWWNEELKLLKEASIESKVTGLSLLNASLVACNIANVFGKTRNSPLSHTLMTLTKLCLIKMALRFGNVGVLNLTLLANAQKLKVTLDQNCYLFRCCITSSMLLFSLGFSVII